MVGARASIVDAPSPTPRPRATVVGAAAANVGLDCPRCLAAGGGALVLLVEADPCAVAAVSGAPAPDSTPLTPDAYLQQVLAFVSAFLVQHEQNSLAVYAVLANSSRLLFASAPLREAVQQPSNAAAAATAPQAIVDGLRRAAGDAAAAPKGDGPHEVAWSAALSRALCFIRRVVAASNAPAGYGPQPRILCLRLSGDVAAQYIPTMNAIFAAQRAEVVVDSCVVSAPSAFLQQAAHLTGGVYLCPARPAGLLQYLLMVFSAPPRSRGSLALPHAADVDFRASCFCHKRLIDLGFVCSVCLSIFCEKTPECSTCGTAFQPRRPPGVKRRAPG